MKFIQLRNFIAVIEAGTFRQAAKNLRLSQSSISKSLQQLEDEIGAEILHRGARGVVPTAAGEALLRRAKHIEAELRHARNDVQMIEGALVGEIRVSVSPTVAIGLLPRAIIKFQSVRPGVSFLISEAVYPDMLPAIRSGEIDVAICLVPARPRDETLNFVSLVKDRLVPVVRATHPIVSARKVTLEDLLDLDWVVYRRSRTGLDVFEQTFASNRLPLPKSTVECTSFACARALVENGDYVTLMPSRLFFDNRKASTVALLALDSPMPAWQVAMITRAKHELSAVCLAFLEEIEGIAAGIAAPKQGARPQRSGAKG
jgi:DNA-binding transcriptional LysR family regulator